jgi:hypothetical protein
LVDAVVLGEGAEAVQAKQPALDMSKSPRRSGLSRRASFRERRRRIDGAGLEAFKSLIAARFSTG